MNRAFELAVDVVPVPLVLAEWFEDPPQPARVRASTAAIADIERFFTGVMLPVLPASVRLDRVHDHHRHAGFPRQDGRPAPGPRRGSYPGLRSAGHPRERP